MKCRSYDASRYAVLYSLLDKPRYTHFNKKIVSKSKAIPVTGREDP
jgi:hypothetical protein